MSPSLRNCVTAGTKLTKNNLDYFDIKSVLHVMDEDIETAKMFLTSWLENEKSTREDYL